MAYALVANTSRGSAAGASITTVGITTTGATLIGVGISTYLGGTAAALSDSNANTWSALTTRQLGSQRLQSWYVSAPSVGVGHTFTATTPDGYPAISVMAFGGALASPLDVQNGASVSFAPSLATGSVTPSQNDELILTWLSFGVSGTISINSGFTIPSGATVNFTGGVTEGVSGAYLIQTTAGAVNPTWSTTGASDLAVAIATFKAAAGARGLFQPPHVSGIGVGGSFFRDRLAQ